MIPPLITTADAVKHLNIDVYDPGLLNGMIMGASAIVMKYCKLTEFPDEWAEEPVESPSVFNVPFDIQCATFLVLGTLWQYREGANPSSFREAQALSDAVKSILVGYRDPTLA